VVSSGGGGVALLEAVLCCVCDVGIAAGVAEGVMEDADIVSAEVEYAVMSQSESNKRNDDEIHPESAAYQMGEQLLAPLLPLIAQIPASEEDRLCSMLSSLSSLLTQAPQCALGHPTTAAAFGTACLSLAQNGALEANTRLQSLNLIATGLSSSTGVAAQFGQLELSPSVNMLGVFFNVSVQHLVNGMDDDVEAWMSDALSLESLHYDGDDMANFAGEVIYTALEAIANRGLAYLYPAGIASLLAPTASWKDQCAGLCLLSIVLSTCSECGDAERDSSAQGLFQAALQLYSVDHPRVKFSVLALIGEMCIADNDSRNIRRSHAGVMLEVIANAFTSSLNKLTCCACLALVSFCRAGNGTEDCADDSVNELCAETLTPHTQWILKPLMEGPLRSNNTVLLIRSIGAVACVASAIGKDFISYYPHVMPGLLTCATGEQNDVMLRGCALEAATIVGQAVGKDCQLFQPDATTIMTIAQPLLNQIKAGDDDNLCMPRDEVLNSCARVASVMGEEFAPFLPLLLELLIQKTQEKPNVSISDNSLPTSGVMNDDDDGTETIPIALPGLGLKKLTLNTTQIYEKVQAARAMFEIATSMPLSFQPFASTALTAFIPAVSFAYSSEVRSTAAQALFGIYQSISGDMKGEAFQNIITPLVTQLEKEDLEEDTSTFFNVADAISDILNDTYKHFSIAPDLISHFIALLTKLFARRSSLISKIAQSADNNYLEVTLKEESEVMTPIVDSIGWILKSHATNIGVVFQQYVSAFLTPLLTCTTDIKAREAAVSLFDDVIEFGGEAVARGYAAPLLQSILDSFTTGDEELYQVCLYGLGQLARVVPDCLVGNEDAIVQFAMQVIGKGDEASRVTLEYAASVLASMVLRDGAPFPNLKTNHITDAFLNCLPAREDDGEAKICHAALGDMVESNVVDLSTHAGTVLRIMAQVISYNQTEGEDIVTEQTAMKYVQVLKRLEAASTAQDGGAIRQAFESLDMDVKVLLRRVMASSA